MAANSSGATSSASSGCSGLAVFSGRSAVPAADDVKAHEVDGVSDRGLCRRLAPCARAGEDLREAEVVADVRRGPVGRYLAIAFNDPAHHEIEGADDAGLCPAQRVVEADQRPGRGSIFDHKRGRDLSGVGVVVGHPVEDVAVIEQADHAAVAGLDVFDAAPNGPAELLLGVQVRDAVKGAGAADHGIVDAAAVDGQRAGSPHLPEDLRPYPRGADPEARTRL
mgnify:CR=1 FL=1